MPLHAFWSAFQCCAKSLSCVWLFAIPWTVACQTPLSMEFSRQEFWSGLPFPSPRDLPDPGNKPRSPALQQILYCLSHQGSPYTLLYCSVTQSCPTLCDPVDCSPPGSSVRGILQARILEWVAIPFSKGSSWPRDRTRVSCTAGRHFTLWATKEAKCTWHNGLIFQGNRESCPRISTE